jgi:thiazole tautomerase (transcriptional regulator TenI)
MRPVICMVTAPIPAASGEDGLVRRIGAAARAGTQLIQIRQPQLDALALTRLVQRAIQAIAGAAARILVNDRVDVALAAGAHGVHLRGNSMAAARVRTIAPPGFVIGRSVHSVEEALEAERGGGLDYLLFGTVFTSTSKPGSAPAGLEVLARACGAVALPVLAIGGVTSSAMVPVARAGAAGFAAIGLFANVSIDAMLPTIERASSTFDTPGTVP